MSLNRPILFTISSFDATQQKIFLFNVESGGNQVVANQLTIRLQSNNSIVYQEKQDSFKFEAILPANTLKNGEYYNASVAVFDNRGNQSPDSLYIQFRCYTQPIIEFTNIPDNNIINNANYEFQFIYKQEQNEPLNNYIVNLYNSEQVLISSSKNIYTENGMPPYSGSYLFSGFENNSIYYVEIVGSTINGAVVESGKNEIIVNYLKPDMFTLLELYNNCDKGYIQVKSNIVLISAETNPTPPIFIDGDSIDVSGEDSYVEWNQGYSFGEDFLVRAWFRNPNKNSQIIKFSNVSGQTITIYYMNGYENVESQDIQSYLQVQVESVQGIEYYIYSNYIAILPENQWYCAYLNRINNIYEIKLLPIEGDGV